MVMTTWPRRWQRGAIAVIGDREGLTELEGVPYFPVTRPRQAGGLLAHALAGNPSEALTVIAYTGTNGKSSSVLITQQVLEAAGHSTAAFGTLGYDIGGETIPAPHTTPFGEDLADMFKKAKDAGHSHVVMEVSSHALEQERVAGIDFNVGVLTNVTQDHLDYHGNMDAYRDAKVKLFERIEGEGRFTVVNQDDPSASYFAKASRVPCHRFSRTSPKDAECFADAIRVESGGTTFMAPYPMGDHRNRYASGGASQRLEYSRCHCRVRGARRSHGAYRPRRRRGEECARPV